ncbi:MAG: ABC transporter ATP-binding protein [Leptolyngbya sp. PLA1]|nr:ABC transporter ATP-binding protein [Leptolyngbya sp. PLA1]
MTEQHRTSRSDTCLLHAHRALGAPVVTAVPARPYPHAVDGLRVNSLCVTWPDGRGALRAVSLAAGPGEVLAVLGPTGSGKTTLLRALAGLEKSEGEVRLTGRSLAALPPHARGVALASQEPALYPHLTVEQNIALSGELRGRADARRLARTSAEALGITDLLTRAPSTLSGGQRQLASLARVLASSPGLALLDEPLASLDAPARVRLRPGLRTLLRGLGCPVLYVTHDHEEAMAIGDRLLILRSGGVEQTGTGDDLFARPASTFVASFLGSPPMNMLAGSVSGGVFTPDGSDSQRVPVPTQVRDGRGTLGIRPRECVLGDQDATIRARVNSVTFVSGEWDVWMSLPGGAEVLCRCGLPPRVDVGATVGVRATRLHWFGPDGAALAT